MSDLRDTEKLEAVKILSQTRFIYAAFTTAATLLVITFADLSDGGEVAAFSFLGVVAAGLGVAKFAEYWKK